ncbi:MAG: hypothetical protein WC876_04660 [Candidatus Thermoplasmatota archaeon]|jgi:hypothetical protein
MRFLVAVTTLAFLTTSIPFAQAATCPVDTTPNFTDACYHEYLLYNVDQAEVDVLILPSASPYALRDATVIKEAVDNWDNGINALGSAWLASGLNIHAYTLGLDPVPADALWDPEIVVVAGEVNPVVLAGIGQQGPASICHGFPFPGLSAGLAWSDLSDVADMPAFHQHEGSPWGMLSAECDVGGRMCFALNTNFLWLPDAANRRDMYDLVGHEFGHCLGIGHVGDALDFTANSYPEDDIMSYENDGHDAGHVLCVSTLNILALEQTYGYLLGQSGYPANTAGGYVHQDPAAWSDDSCPEPTATYTDLAPVLAADPLGGIL